MSAGLQGDRSSEKAHEAGFGQQEAKVPVKLPGAGQWAEEGQGRSRPETYPGRWPACGGGLRDTHKCGQKSPRTGTGSPHAVSSADCAAPLPASRRLGLPRPAGPDASSRERARESEEGELRASLGFPAAAAAWGGAFLPRVFFFRFKVAPHPREARTRKPEGQPHASRPTERPSRLRCSGCRLRTGGHAADLPAQLAWGAEGLRWFLSLVSSLPRAAVLSGMSAETGRWPLSLGRLAPEPGLLLPSEGFSWKPSASGL